MAEHVRIRVRFTPATEDPCWLLVDLKKLKTIGDLTKYICSKCLSANKSAAVKLFMRNFVLPSWETSDILQNGDLIQVVIKLENSPEDENDLNANPNVDQNKLVEETNSKKKRKKRKKKNSVNEITDEETQKPVDNLTNNVIEPVSCHKETFENSRFTKKRKIKENGTEAECISTGELIKTKQEICTDNISKEAFTQNLGKILVSDDKTPLLVNENTKTTDANETAGLDVSDEITPASAANSRKRRRRRRKKQGNGSLEDLTVVESDKNTCVANPCVWPITPKHYTDSTEQNHKRFDSDEDIKEPNCEIESIENGSTSEKSHFGQPSTVLETTPLNKYVVFKRNRQFKEFSKSAQLNSVLTNSSVIYENAESEKLKSVNYEELPTLTGTPRLGDRIAFKMIELGENYNPVVSDYQEGEVKSYDPVSNNVSIQKQRVFKDLSNNYERRKFDIDVEDDDLVLTNREQPTDQLTVCWNVLLEPKLLPPSSN